MTVHMGHRRGGAAGFHPRSDPLNPDRCRQLVGKMAQVFDVGREDCGLTSGGDDGEMGIDDIGSRNLVQESADLMGVIRGETDDVAAPQHAPQLHLSRRAADLGDDRCGRPRHEPKLQTSPMISPDVAVVALGGHKHAGVVDEAHAGRD